MKLEIKLEEKRFVLINLDTHIKGITSFSTFNIKYGTETESFYYPSQTQK